jgi:hypothetical protein
MQTPYYLLLLVSQVALKRFPNTPSSGRVGVQRRILMEPLSLAKQDLKI